MDALLTSSNRPDLLRKTLDSFIDQTNKFHLDEVLIHEDFVGNIGYNIDLLLETFPEVDGCFTRGLGQHGSIEKFLKGYDRDFYIHLEDDWEFNNTYDWIDVSKRIMEEHAHVIKVLARVDSPHPCNHPYMINGIPYGFIDPWTGEDSIKWHGFSWNPGVTRVKYLKEFMPFPKWEQDLAERIYKAGYRVVELGKPVYKHIGDGRSTH